MGLLSPTGEFSVVGTWWDNGSQAFAWPVVQIPKMAAPGMVSVGLPLVGPLPLPRTRCPGVTCCCRPRGMSSPDSKSAHPWWCSKLLSPGAEGPVSRTSLGLPMRFHPADPADWPAPEATAKGASPLITEGCWGNLSARVLAHSDLPRGGVWSTVALWLQQWDSSWIH